MTTVLAELSVRVLSYSIYIANYIINIFVLKSKHVHGNQGSIDLLADNYNDLAIEYLVTNFCIARTAA